MLDGLFGRKFSAKCKESVRCIKTRICFIRKKRQVTINILKKDIADLLAEDHADNAFQRIDELLEEINKLSCYNMVEQFCDQILAQLPTLSKQREDCPQQEREAVATLIFAAARFHDLPELGRLRHNFLSRYSDNLNLDSSVNKLFVQKISGETFTIDKKLKLMSEISEEFSVSWDAIVFDKKKNIRSTSDLAKTTMEMPDEEVKDIVYTAKKQVTENKLTQSYGMHSFNYKDYRLAAATKEQVPGFGTVIPTEKVNNVAIGDTESKPRRNRHIETEYLSFATAVKEKRQLSMIPPPYVKPGKNRNATGVFNAILTESSSVHEPDRDRDNSINIPILSPEPESGGREQKTEKQKPTSVRTRRIYSNSKPKPRLPADENGGFGNDRLYETETKMDEILNHYSRKGIEGELKTSERRLAETNIDDILDRYSRKGMEISDQKHEKNMMNEQAVRKPGRSLTFPANNTADENGNDKLKKRTVSLDSNVAPRVCHVHPRLPDCDELAATFNALKPSCNKKLSPRGI